MHAAILQLHPRDGVISPRWCAIAMAWIESGPASGEVCTPARSDDLVAHDHSLNLTAWPARNGEARLIAGGHGGPLRAVHASFVKPEVLVLAGGGPESTDDELLADFDALVDIARRVASETSYAFVAIEPTFQLLDDICRPDPAASCDDSALDGFPYQVLGPGHVARIRARASELGPLPLRPRAGGRVELSIGPPAGWLFSDGSRGRRDATIDSRARELLAPCIFRWHGLGSSLLPDDAPS